MNSYNWQLIGFQLAIVVPFVIGSLLQRNFPQVSKIAAKIVLLNLIVFEPPIILWSIWGLALRGEMFFLPVAGLIMVMFGFYLGRLMTPLLSGDALHRKVFVISASLANHGFTMGGVICYLFLGEKGLALSAIFILYFIPFTFLFIFFYAGSDSSAHGINFRYLFDFIVNFRNMPLFAVTVAIALRFMEVSRPALDFPLNTLLAISISLYYFSLGINFKAGDLNPLSREHGLLATIKFIIIPIITFVMLQMVDLSADIRQVILIESFMPVAVYAVITSVLFNLNTRLASSLFIVNSTMFLTALLPIFYFFK